MGVSCQKGSPHPIPAPGGEGTDLGEGAISRATMTKRGYTLVEVLLVLALLVLAAGLAAPVIFHGGARATLQDAAEKVSQMWGRARLDAASSGQTYVFRCASGGMSCETAPLGATAVEVIDPNDPVLDQTTTLELDESVVIHSLLVGEPAGAELVGGEVASSSAMPVVIFRPDGATSDAEAILQHESGRQIRVTLRGLTGATRVDDPAETEE